MRRLPPNSEIKKPKKELIHYTTILHEQKQALGISCVEYCLLDTIDKLSRPACRIGRQRLADWLELSRQGVIKAINRLESKKLLVRINNKELKVTEKWHRYVNTDENESVNKVYSGVNKVDSKCKQSLQTTSNKTSNRIKEEKDNPLEQVPKSPPVKYSKQDEEIATLHYNEVLSSFPKTVTVFDKDKWSNAVRLLREVQKYTYEEISGMLAWSRSNTFWSKVGQSLPALRMVKNDKPMKVGSLYDQYIESLDKDNTNNPAQSKEVFLPEAEWGDDTPKDRRSIKICNGITSCLKDVFKDEGKIVRLVNLVETIEHMTSYGYINIWRSYREGKPVLFSRGDIQSKPEDAYPNFFKKIKGDFVGFKDITLDTALFNEFEDFVCSRRMYINHNDAKDLLMNKKFSNHDKRLKAWKKYLKKLDKNSDNYYFTR